MSDIYLLSALIFVAAILYSSVGHAGASGYLAAMALMSVSPDSMKPLALSLNVLVASVASIRFAMAGCFSWSTLWPFMITSIPAAFFGGAIQLPGYFYKNIVGGVLIFTALRLVLGLGSQNPSPRPPSTVIALIAGGAIGILSGLTGTGGGIFLSPLLLLMGWADVRKTAGVSAVFILVNSVAGILGYVLRGQTLPSGLVPLALAAVLGGLIGSELGSKRVGNVALRRILALVLVIAGGKMIFVV